MKTISSTIYEAFVLFVLASFALLPAVQAVVPAPDGGYPGQNTAEGQSALLHLAGGTYNTALGWASLGFNVTGNDNTGIGPGALSEVTEGNRNVAVGLNTLGNRPGDNNVALGNNAGVSQAPPSTATTTFTSATTSMALLTRATPAT